MKDSDHRLRFDFLNNFIHIGIMKGGSYEGSPGAKAQDVKGQELRAGYSSTCPVSLTPEAVAPGTPVRPQNDNGTSRTHYGRAKA